MCYHRPQGSGITVAIIDPVYATEDKTLNKSRRRDPVAARAFHKTYGENKMMTLEQILQQVIDNCKMCKECDPCCTGNILKKGLGKNKLIL